MGTDEPISHRSKTTCHGTKAVSCWCFLFTNCGPENNERRAREVNVC